MSLKINPLTENQLKTLDQVTAELTADQILWVSGYLAGRLSAIQQNGNGTAALTAIAKEVKEESELTILYGTDTGRSETLAGILSEKAKERNIKVQSFSMYDYNPRKLKEEKNIAVIVSTHGEGEPPAMAEDFHKFIINKRAPKLKNVKFSVLALGDKSYKFFCQTGKDVDEAFTTMGAINITPLVTCDVDFEDDADNWMNNLLENLTPEAVSATNGHGTLKPATTQYSKKNPFMATLLEKVKITGRESDKEVYHLEFSLEDSGLTYEPGDAVGIYTQNPQSLVKEILNKLNFSPSETVNLKTGEVTLEEALTRHLEITILTREVLINYFAKTASGELEKLLSDDKLLDDYLYGHDVLDLLEDFPYQWKAQHLVDILRQLPPRLYSISSSQEHVGEEVHLTVSAVRYERDNRVRTGACSSFLSYNLEPGDKVPVYIDKNPSFKLPANGNPIIMVGAGTGIAPYRAFMQQIESQNLKNNTWLFFGDRRFYSDFLYQLEWQKLLKSKRLQRMEVAFSRDQKEKVYIQHKLLAHKKEVFEWLEKGANFYLCGDQKTLGKDVNKTLLEIIKTEGGISTEKAEEYVKQLKREKRLQIDVY